MKSIRLKAYAKINLLLDVFSRRADGYHEVEMVMQGINLYDVLEIRGQAKGKGNGKGNGNDTGNNISLACNIRELANNRENLAYRAADLLCNDFPAIGGVEISLHKNIPVAAGLAGGSSDAAAVLVGMNELFGLKIQRERMLSYAALLGSDVAFCLQPLTALAQGRGEIIKSLPLCPRLWMALAKPAFGVATREVYNHLSKVNVAARPNLQLALKALSLGDREKLYRAMGNVLEFSTYDLYPRLRVCVEKLQQAGAHKVMMAGSGPTLIAFCHTREEAEMIRAKWTEPGWEVFETRTLEAKDLIGKGHAGWLQLSF